MNDELSVDSILDAGGSISRRLKNYEPRQQQLAMAREVAAALKSEQHLVVEAGTGTGKSFAYLTPAILHATDDQGQPPTSAQGDDEPRRRRVLISTHTISLQEQLIGKDVPLLNSVIPREFSAVLVKGRSNYLSIRRMNRAISRATSLFADDEQLSQLARSRTGRPTVRTDPFRLCRSDPIRAFGTRSPATPAIVCGAPANTTRSVSTFAPDGVPATHN